MFLKTNCEIKIIFFILMVVGYVISALYKKESQKEKERRINKRPVNPRTSEEIFKELQKSLNQSNKPEPLKPTVEGKSKPFTKVVKPKMETTLKNEAIRMSAQKVKAKHSNIKPSIELKSKPMSENVQVEEKELEYRPDFDLRKAVLFSEILRRPQY